MALRHKEFRSHHHSALIKSHEISLSPQVRKKAYSPLKTHPDREHLPSIHSSIDLMKMRAKGHNSSVLDTGRYNNNRSQVIFVACVKHPGEPIKFIDVSTTLCDTHCEVCIINSTSSLNQVKLERVGDLQVNIETFLKSQIEQLKALEHRVELMTKEIKVTNSLNLSLTAKLDYMHKKATTLIDDLFRGLKKKFTKYNPFESTREEIHGKLEKFEEKLEVLGQHDDEAMEGLRDMIRNKRRMRDETKYYIENMTKKLDGVKNEQMPYNKEMGMIENAFDDFIMKFTKLCDKFGHTLDK